MIYHLVFNLPVEGNKRNEGNEALMLSYQRHQKSVAF